MATESPRSAAPDKVTPCPPSGRAGRPSPERAPADGPPVSLAEQAAEAPRRALFVATYRDERFFFPDGGWARFGRDDERCHITVWEELRGTLLSRVAGELWCTEGEMWVRNLSQSHELVVAGAVGQPHLLTPRAPGTRGGACSVPAPEGIVYAPSTGDWQLVTHLVRPVPVRARPGWREGADPQTTSVDPPPEALRDVAAALCAPVILRGEPPASYDAVAEALGISRRHARRRVEQLCDHYRARVPELLGPFAQPQSALYVPVALLLVDRGRVCREDILALRTRGRDPARGAEG